MKPRIELQDDGSVVEINPDRCPYCHLEWTPGVPGLVYLGHQAGSGRIYWCARCKRTTGGNGRPEKIGYAYGD